MARISNQPIKMIRARVQMTRPDRTQYKPYDTELVFDEPVYVDVPVPASEVTIEGGVITLTLHGWTAFLDAYSTAVEEMHKEYQNRFR